jgi:type III secretory pathway component EscS
MLDTFATQAHGIEKLSILLLFLLFVACIVGILVFEIKMIVHAIQNETLGSGQKTAWIIGMLLVHPFIACAYYVFIYSRPNTDR